MKEYSEELHQKARSTGDLEVRLDANAKFGSANLHEWIFRQFALPNDAVILELGCGTGLQTEIMSRLCKEGTIYATDPAKDSLDVIAAKRLANVKTACLDMDALAPLPLKEKFFDAVFCAYAFYYSKTPAALIEALAPLLKPQGKFVVVGPYGDNNRELWNLIESVYPIGEEILYSQNEFMTDTVERTCKRFFSNISKTFFENTVSYPTPEALFAYIAASTTYKEEKKKELKAAIEAAFRISAPFVVTKKAMCLVAEI